MRALAVPSIFALALSLACGTSGNDNNSVVGAAGDVYAVSESGTRLHAQFVTTPDGIRSFAGWIDTGRGGERCSFARASDGLIRCLPLDDCRVSVGGRYQCSRDAACPNATIAITASGGSGEVPPSSFVAATPRTVTFGSVSAVLYDAEDGAKAFGHFADPNGGFACLFTTLDEGQERRCVPLHVAHPGYPGGTLFTDAQCTSSAFGGRYVVSGACADARFAEEGGGTTHYATLGEPVPLSNLSVGNAQFSTCKPISESTIALRPLGDPVPTSAFVRAVATPAPSSNAALHRLTPIVLDLGDNHWVEDRAGAFGSDLGDYGERFGRFVDSTLGGATCTFRATADGLRCVPTDPSSSSDGNRFFSNAACTNPLGTAEWRTVLETTGTTVTKVSRGRSFAAAAVFTRDPPGGCVDTGKGCPCVEQARSELPPTLFIYEDVPLSALAAGVLSAD